MFGVMNPFGTEARISSAIQANETDKLDGMMSMQIAHMGMNMKEQNVVHLAVIHQSEKALSLSALRGADTNRQSFLLFLLLSFHL